MGKISVARLTNSRHFGSMLTLCLLGDGIVVCAYDISSTQQTDQTTLSLLFQDRQLTDIAFIGAN